MCSLDREIDMKDRLIKKQIAGLERRIARAIERGHSEENINCLRASLEALRGGEVQAVRIRR